MALEVHATGIEKGKFVTGDLTLEDLFYEMGAPRGVAVAEEEDVFRFSFGR
tara:strand:+ start:152 stop:304 length:153 start_codon:yes stop_codon:yes gene_type:complete